MDRYEFTNMNYQIEVNVLIFMEMLFSFGSEQKIETGNGTQCQSKKLHKDNIDVRQKIRLAFSSHTKNSCSYEHI